ncbi:hypothetical protein [Flexithrix dorotheae]|uniref:hypothetical protein n=1 Tax=Flexithrix dorotheae TaxID=70993 RepID=UPI0003685795|nr:hypothetical protein [Flexithrix dorotheae]
MSKEEFYSIMPILLYGIAVGDLVMHFKDYFHRKKPYWPHIVTGLLFLELAFFNFYMLFYHDLPKHENYFFFLKNLITPILFLLTVAVYTPNNETDAKTYFHAHIRIVFCLFAAFILSHFVIEANSNIFSLARLIGVILSLCFAFTEKLTFLWMMVGLRFIGFFLTNY